MKVIPLTQGKLALVDDADFEWLNQWKWHYRAAKNGKPGYAVHNVRAGVNKQRSLKMHRLVAGAVAGTEVDHRDGNKLNNQRANLRLATSAENGRNKSIKCTATSGYKGVTWRKDASKWQARITLNYKRVSLGMFSNSFDAAKAYNEAAQRLHGDFARLNVLQ